MQQPTQLLIRLFIAYCLVLIIGNVCIIFNNIFLLQFTLHSMMSFHLPFLFFSDLLFTLFLMVISWWRLKPIVQYRDKETAFKRLLQFPYELLGGVILLSVVFICLFHLIEISYLKRIQLASPGGLQTLLISMSTELSLTFVIALMLFVFCKSVVRPYLIQLSLTAVPMSKQNSILRQISLAVVFGFLILLMVIARISVFMLEEGVSNLLRYIGILIVYLLFVMTMVLLLIRSWRRDLAVVSERLRLLSEQDMMLPIEGIPIFSYDETASLSLSFNKLQSQLASMHQELAGQLALARHLQQKLMPQTIPKNDQLELAAYCQPCYEVGGDFYDVISLNEKRLLIAIGDVSGKGMSAAMLMAAMLAALRIEAAKGGSPGELLTRLNEHIYSITEGRAFVTVGLALVDVEEEGAHVTYSSAGHMSPYIVDDNGLHELERAAIPLGMAEEKNYSEAEFSFKLAQDQILIFYTDGIIETLNTDGQMLGFEGWEQELLNLDRKLSLSQQLQHLLRKLPQTNAQKRADDRTLLLMRCDSV